MEHAAGFAEIPELPMKREALVKLNRQANEMAPAAAEVLMAAPTCTVTVQ